MAKSATVSEVRAWGRQNGFVLGDRGRLPAEVWSAWEARQAVPSQRTQPTTPQVSAADFAAAQQRIADLEEHMAALADRLNTLEGRVAQPRRRFARSR